MKKTFPLLALGAFLLLAAFTSVAQQELKVDTFKLKNGLKVILCEEHSAPEIFGCVLVHAGSKNEKPTATGVAHYFEHIMFKGTDLIGTIDWENEKLYLDSISQAYDRLQATNDAKQRHNIQLEINRLSIAASKYAIPNEVDAILQQMGCTGLNAGTSYDNTVYYNILPSNQLAKWMDVYVERFRNPVFRLFQTELEAVYEEKNMYENRMGYDFSRNIFTEAFGEHPYSRDVIGLSEHLKNPQPSEMQQFFNTYYVANNMTLLLVGDFKTAEARRLIEDKFSTWRSGELPQTPQYNLPKFDKQKVVNVKQTPIKMGIMLFPGVAKNHPDYLPLTMLSEILAGGSGLLDRAATENRIMMAQLVPLSLSDAGANAVIYVPNIVGQNHEKAEQVVWDCIDSIKQGNFSDEQLESIKNAALVSYQRQVESPTAIGQLLLGLEMNGQDYDQWKRDIKRWMSLTRDEIIDVTNRYFDRDHCTLIRSKMGFPKHNEAVKPDWEHLEAQNRGAKSPFAKAIESIHPDPVRPQVVDFKKDVSVTDITPNCTLYAARNPKNDVFELDLVYHYGELDDPDLSMAVSYMELLGAEGMTLQQFNMAMNYLGGSVYISVNHDLTHLYITGLEQNLDSILSLTARWLAKPNYDPLQIAKLVDAIKAEQKSARNSSDSWSSALRHYVMLGANSIELSRMPYKEWGKLTGEQLHDEVMKIFTRNGHVTFTGNTDPFDLSEKLRRYDFVRADVDVQPRRDFPNKCYDKSQLIYAHNKKFLQSDIYFYMPSVSFDTADEAAAILFNEYFGMGMNSIVFQEIREFRSLGYSTYSNFRYDNLNRNPSYNGAYLGTQCDKTYEGVEALRDLLVALPDRPDKLAPAVEHKVASRNCTYIGFRSLPNFVQESMERGWTRDQRADITNRISHLTMDDLRAFHKKYIAGRPMVVMVSGNTKRFDTKDVAKLLGADVKATEVKFDQMFKF